MTRIAPLSGTPTDGAAAAVFEEVTRAFGTVPNLFRVYAHHPPLLRANWEKVKAVMMAGGLRRQVKETIALLVSHDNGCTYCVAAHSAALKSLGVAEQHIAALERDLGVLDFTPKEVALIELARHANRDPHAIREERFDRLRELDATEAEVVEALGVMEVYAAFNRFLDTLDVAIDF